MLRCITEYKERKSLESNFKRCSRDCFESFVYDGKGLGGEYGAMGILQFPEIKEILSRTYAVTRFINQVQHDAALCCGQVVRRPY